MRVAAGGSGNHFIGHFWQRRMINRDH
jgi:hypothetical protein